MIEESEDDAQFWKFLGGKGPVASAEAGGCDEDAENLAKVEKTLLKLSDATGAFQVQEVGKGKSIKKSLLDSNDVFILDAGQEVLNTALRFSCVQELKVNRLLPGLDPRQALERGSMPSNTPKNTLLRRTGTLLLPSPEFWKEERMRSGSLCSSKSCIFSCTKHVSYFGFVQSMYPMQNDMLLFVIIQLYYCTN